MNAGENARSRVCAALLALLLVGTLFAPGCGGKSGEAKKRTPLVLATTTSLEDTALLEVLMKRFEEQYPYDLKAVAVGSGAALFMGRNGDADVMITHEPVAEGEFIAAGYGESINKLMHNDFIIVGPPGDPAGIKGMKDAAAAVKKVADSKSTFISRADASGTNAMELAIWGWASVTPEGSWYIPTGGTMAGDLRIADEKKAYTLTDRATYTVLAGSLSLKPMVQDDPRLVNQYSITVVNPKRFADLNYTGAQQFLEFMMSPETRKLISGYGWDKYHLHLFYPDT